MIFINSSQKDALKIFQPFLPIFVPVGIGYLMGVFQEVGIKCICFDEQIDKNIPEKIKEYVSTIEPPYIFGFSVLSNALKNAISLSVELKQQYPDSVIIFGGIHPTAMPDEMMAYEHIDVVVRGEAEDIIVELYQCLKNKKDFTHLESISYRRNGQIIHNARSKGIENLDNLPSFPYELLSNKKYDFGFVIGSRGCPHNCFFCSNKINSQRKFRYRSSESIVNDLRLLYYKFNRKYINFLDDDLLTNHTRIRELVEAIKKSDIYKKMHFNFNARGDNCNEEILQLLFDAGFSGVYFGIETASERVMKMANKGETVQEVVDAIRIAKKIGFFVSCNFIFGLPGETPQDRKDAFKLTKELDIDIVKYNNATPYPGTQLYQIAKNQNRLYIYGLYENLNTVSSFIDKPFQRTPFSYIPEGNTEKQIEYDIYLGFLKFYFNYKRFIKVFTNPDKNIAWFDFGHNFKDFIYKFPSILLLLFFLSLKFSLFLVKYPLYLLYQKVKTK